MIRLLCETLALWYNLFIFTLACVQNKTITNYQNYKTISGDMYYYSSGGITAHSDSQLLYYFFPYAKQTWFYAKELFAMKKEF